LKALRGKLKPDRVVGAIQSREQEVIRLLYLPDSRQGFYHYFSPCLLSFINRGVTDEKMRLL
jgi:hypothetical protein